MHSYDNYVDRKGKWTGTPDPESGVKHLGPAEVMALMNNQKTRDAIKLMSRVQGPLMAEQIERAQCKHNYEAAIVAANAAVAAKTFQEKINGDFAREPEHTLLVGLDGRPLRN